MCTREGITATSTGLLQVEDIPQGTAVRTGREKGQKLNLVVRFSSLDRYLNRPAHESIPPRSSNSHSRHLRCAVAKSTLGEAQLQRGRP